MNTVFDRPYARKNEGSADDKLEIKSLLDSLKTRDGEIKAWCEKATEEIKNTGKVATDTKSALEKLSEEGVKTNARILELEQKLARRGGSEDPIVKTVGEMLTESDDFKALSQKGRGTARLNMKAVANLTSGTGLQGGLGNAIVPDRQPGILMPTQRQFFVRDLIMPGRTASNAIEYVQESGFTNSAAPVAEGAAKPQSDITFELKTTTVKTIAHWFRASKQVLADIPLLQSYINGRAIFGLKYVEEEQLLAGDGTGQNLLGLVPQATAFDDARRKQGDTPIDTLRHAILQTRLAEYRATGIILNPVDWEGIELQKDANGQYIWVNVQQGGTQVMWKLPVVDTTAIGEGEFLVGAFDLAAQVFDREDAGVEVSTEDADNFTKNMVTIRAEERLALAVYRPDSFIHGTFVKAA